jgi:adenylate kinase family enzyme
MHHLQSTLGAALAKELRVPSIPLDRLNWSPGWRETPAEEFRNRVKEAMDNNPEGWVIDGNSTKKIGNLVNDNATDIICRFSSVSVCHFDTLVHRA